MRCEAMRCDAKLNMISILRTLISFIIFHFIQPTAVIFNENHKQTGQTIRKKWKNERKIPSNNIKVTKALTMTIAVINAIKNKFTCLKKEFERNTRNERQTQFMAWQSSVARIGSDRIPGIWRQLRISLNRYCHQCTQNGSILDFNQSLFALRAVRGKIILHIFPLANKMCSVSARAHAVHVQVQVHSHISFCHHRWFHSIFFLSISIFNVKCNQFQLKRTDKIHSNTENGCGRALRTLQFAIRLSSQSSIIF